MAVFGAEQVAARTEPGCDVVGIAILDGGAVIAFAHVKGQKRIVIPLETDAVIAGTAMIFGLAIIILGKDGIVVCITIHLNGSTTPECSDPVITLTGGYPAIIHRGCNRIIVRGALQTIAVYTSLKKRAFIVAIIRFSREPIRSAAIHIANTPSHQRYDTIAFRADTNPSYLQTVLIKTTKGKELRHFPEKEAGCSSSLFSGCIAANFYGPGFNQCKASL
ncbi:MAG TPA: hypothetical protein V6C52_02670 [Coleofasciculaceae cyanobacterium]